MKIFAFKYGPRKLHVDIEESDILDTLIPDSTSPLPHIEEELIKVMENPTGTLPLRDIIHKEEKVVIIVSDITRLWIKTNQFLIHIITYLNKLGIEDDRIEIITALGTHRPSSEEEKKSIVGKDVYQRIQVTNHDCFDKNELCYLGESSFGTPIYINKRVMDADRVILTGGVVFHLFAGFGGGAKSMVPGVAGLESIQHNHCLTFHKGDGTGLNHDASSNKIHGNPMREDITEICRKVNPDFLINAVLDAEGNFVKFVAGDFEKAWLEGCEFIRTMYGIDIEEKADIIVASAGGYPKDINLYQSVKTMDNCLHGGKEDSIVILASECGEGLGAEEFLQWFQYKTLKEMERALKSNFTVPGYAAYKTAYAGVYRKLILISSLPDDVVKQLGFLPASSMEDALALAYTLSPSNPKIRLMPFGGNTLPILNQ